MSSVRTVCEEVEPPPRYTSPTAWGSPPPYSSLPGIDAPAPVPVKQSSIPPATGNQGIQGEASSSSSPPAAASTAATTSSSSSTSNRRQRRNRNATRDNAKPTHWEVLKKKYKQSDSNIEFMKWYMAEGSTKNKRSWMWRIPFCILSVASIIMGSIYANDCPAHPFVIAYPLAAGPVFLIQSLLDAVNIHIKVKRGKETEDTKCIGLILALTLFAQFGIRIGATAHIYSAYDQYQSYDPTIRSSEGGNGTRILAYCNDVIYDYAFATLTLSWAGLISIPIFLIILCILLAHL